MTTTPPPVTIETTIQEAVLLAARRAPTTQRFHTLYCLLAAPYKDQPHVQDLYATEAERIERLARSLPEVTR